MSSGEVSRRTLLKSTALLAGAATGSARLFADVPGMAKAFSAYRAQMAATSIQEVKLTNLISMFTGPGANVVVRHGLYEKVVVDTFAAGAFPAFKQHLDVFDKTTPITYVINTSWPFDHTGNNDSFRKAGAEIVAHENTKRRLSKPYEFFGARFDASPAAALPTQTFTTFRDVKVEVPPGEEEYIDLAYVPHAYTDTDIYAHFVMGDVMHLGGTFTNGMYPVIDVDAGGTIAGMIAGAEHALKGANPDTKIVPGRGSLANRDALTSYRDMLVTVRDRVQKLKMDGRNERDVIVGKPTADLDAKWGQGFVPADAFVSMVYRTL